MKTTHYEGSRRVTPTAGPNREVTVQIIGDMDADGRVISASICVGGDFLLMPEEGPLLDHLL